MLFASKFPRAFSPAVFSLTSSRSILLRTSSHHVLPRMLTSTPSTHTDQSPKPFKDIPGPKGYPLIGTALDYRKDMFTISNVVKRRFDKYGSIYREAIFTGLPEQLMIFDPNDIETVFRADGEWPVRFVGGGDIMKKLFKAARVNSVGIFSSNGEKWHKMRSPISKFTLVPRKIAEYHEDFNNITLDLLKNIELKKHPDTAILSNVPRHLFNWSFESVAFFAFRRRFGALDLYGASPESQEFIDTVKQQLSVATELLFSVPLYLIYPTKTWKKAVNSMRNMYQLAEKMINERLAEIKEEERRALEAASGEEEAPDKVDLLTYLVHSGKLSIEEVSANIADLLGAGIETTSYTLSWMLYLLATNPEAQEKLRSEIQRVVGSDQIVTPAHISKMSYLRNVRKETQRLYPVSGFIMRRLQKDVVLSGYTVPKGTDISIPQTIIGRIPELYPEPEKFLPERWDRGNKDKLPSMFAHLPFGFGARMCAGRRVAELELFIALTHLIREYRVDCLDKEPMGYKQNLFVNPDRQLDLVFQKL